MQHRPDLVYIEFAVNDYADWQQASVNTESILRQIRGSNAEAEIVFVFTITKSIRDRMDRENVPYRSRDLQLHLARRYGIPTVDVGEAL